jgi:hypothetical protein
MNYVTHCGALYLKREHKFQFKKCNLIEVLIAQHKTQISLYLTTEETKDCHFKLRFMSMYATDPLKWALMFLRRF